MGGGLLARGRARCAPGNVLLELAPEFRDVGLHLSFVIINRLGNCGLVRPGDDEKSKVDARETRLD